LSLILTRILLTAFIFRPINDLISETEKLSKGDLNIRLGNAHPHSEIGALRHAINSLATTLRRQTEKQDITERLIRLQETQFRAIADFSSNWEYWINPDGAFGYVSSACERISGYKPEEFSCDADVLKNILHPDDRESFNAHCQDNHTSPSNQHSPIEFRILTKGGKLRWIFHTCQPVFDPAHLYLGRRATNQDITERKTAEEALRSSEERFRNMIETQAEGIAILNTDTEFIFVNAAAEVIFCALPHNLVGHNIQEFLESEQLSLFNTLLNSSQKDEKTTHEINITRLDGQKRILLVTVTPQFAKDSSFTGIMGIFRDVTDIKQREERLRFTSTHDRLTGLFNRNYLEEEIQKLQQSELWPISIIVVDMDDLKLINDKYGHIHGDKALQRAAAILKNLFRPWDIVARYGGDEFVVLLPEIDANQGKDILRRVKQAINSFNQTHPDKMVNVSVGLATGEKGTSLKKVFQQADEQMYLDKQSKE